MGSLRVLEGFRTRGFGFRVLRFYKGSVKVLEGFRASGGSRLRSQICPRLGIGDQRESQLQSARRQCPTVDDINPALP